MTLISKDTVSVTVILLFGEHDEMFVSRVNLPKIPWWEVEALNAASGAVFGGALRVVRCLAGDENFVETWDRAYALEFLDSAHARPREPLSGTFDPLSTGLPPGAAVVLKDLLAARRNASGSRLSICEPWTLQGWHARVENFASKVIPNPQPQQKAVWKQLRTWPRSCVYEICSDGSRYILKACPPAYASEGPVTAYLAKLRPDLIADVLAVDPADNILLSRAFSGNDASAESTPVLKAAANGLAELQYVVSTQRGALSRFGLAVTDLPALMGSMHALLADEPALMPEHGGLSDSEVEQLRSAESRIADSFNRLRSIGIPLSIEHGDFRAGNVLNDADGNFRIIDWSCTSIGHPFFSAAQLIDEEEHSPDPLTNSKIKIQLARSYLEGWQALGLTAAELEEALSLARLLMPIARAIERRERLLPSLAYPLPWSFSAAFWARRFLIRLAEQN
ncbi:MAG: phosphotransferase [Elusimicrobiota bacterium]|nr:phosphotransferase [Elusimicrobiota bacterium]